MSKTDNGNDEDANDSTGQGPDLNPQQIENFNQSLQKQWHIEPVYQTEFYSDITGDHWDIIKALADTLLPEATGEYPEPVEDAAGKIPTDQLTTTVSGKLELRRIPKASDVGVMCFLRNALEDYLEDKVPYFLTACRALELLAQQPPLSGEFQHLKPEHAALCVSSLERDLPEVFTIVRKHIIEGYFCDERHGSNKDYITWKMIDLDSVVLEKNIPFINTGLEKNKPRKPKTDT